MIKETNDVKCINELSSYNVTLNPFNKILTYIIDNDIVGFLDYSKMYEKMEINYIYVKEEYRSKGIASSLIKYMIDNNEFENITLEVNVNNTNAINLYKKFNFNIVSIREKYYGNTDGYLMELRNI